MIYICKKKLIKIRICYYLYLSSLWRNITWKIIMLVLTKMATCSNPQLPTRMLFQYGHRLWQEKTSIREQNYTYKCRNFPNSFLFSIFFSCSTFVILQLVYNFSVDFKLIFYKLFYSLCKFIFYMKYLLLLHYFCVFLIFLSRLFSNVSVFPPALVFLPWILNLSDIPII